MPSARTAPFARSTAVLLLAALTAGPALAGPGISLAWNHCLGEGTGVQNRTFACDSNVGTHVMVGSFILGSDLPLVIGHEVVIDLATASPTLPAWWRYVTPALTPECRSSALSANFVPDPPAGVCVDWSGGLQVGGTAYCPSGGPCVDSPANPNTARIKVVAAVAQQQATDLMGGVEYFSFNVTIRNDKTVGTGSCEGCSVPVCLVLNSINVVDRGDLHSRKLTTPTAPGSNYVTWQGGGVPVVGAVTGCPAATPVRRATWGAVRSLYQ